MFCAHSWAIFISSSVSVILVISLCFLSAISSSRCSQDGSKRARSIRSASNDSRAASNSFVTWRCTSFACWILVAEPTHRVVGGSWNLFKIIKKKTSTSFTADPIQFYKLFIYRVAQKCGVRFPVPLWLLELDPWLSTSRSTVGKIVLSFRIIISRHFSFFYLPTGIFIFFIFWFIIPIFFVIWGIVIFLKIENFSIFAIFCLLSQRNIFISSSLAVPIFFFFAILVLQFFFNFPTEYFYF